MTEQRLSFNAWQSLVHTDPAQVVDQFFTRYEQLAPESRKAFIATHPEREALLQ